MTYKPVLINLMFKLNSQTTYTLTYVFNYYLPSHRFTLANHTVFDLTSATTRTTLTLIVLGGGRSHYETQNFEQVSLFAQ